MASRSGRRRGDYDFVVVANRLPVDRVQEGDGTVRWARSPGGLVTALEPVMRHADGAWVGWAGTPGEAPEPFDDGGMRLVGVPLSEDEVTRYYEGFSNGTLWPLYHDVIAAPEYHREWWEAYVTVNRRFAEATADQAAEGATIWVQDYQLQLVPAQLRSMRPDLRIGFFNHIPFPPYEIYAQLPWRRQILEGLLGSDLLGFQRKQDANNFLRACRRSLNLASTAHRLVVRERVQVPGTSDHEVRERVVRAGAFPISIDSSGFAELASTPEVTERARVIRAELGSPRHVLLGVDRLDYTKGIAHRLHAFGELLDEGRVDPADTVLIQVATPSRERVDHYRALRDDIELTVGRINGAHSTLGRTPVVYLHHSQPREEMAALYQAADVMLVTSLRDGMNLVAKEYVACRTGGTGALVLSEFTGAADELGQALLVNPHDIEGLKDTMVTALLMNPREQARRMRSLRRRVLEHDVARWAAEFLAAMEEQRTAAVPDDPAGDAAEGGALPDALERLLAQRPVLLAFDFDGVLAPIVQTPDDARALPRSLDALRRLAEAEGVQVALVSGRSLRDLRSVAEPPPGVVLVASHGAEVEGAASPEVPKDLLERVTSALQEVVGAHPGTSLEHKPTATVLHTRSAEPDVAAAAAAAALAAVDDIDGARVIEGKQVVEVTVVPADKGTALRGLRDRLGAGAVLYAGDDVTDEDALRTLDAGAGDVGVKVGPGETAAAHRVDDPEKVADLLESLADRLSR